MTYVLRFVGHPTFGEFATLPERQTPGSVGYDLAVAVGTIVHNDEVVLIPTGLMLAEPLPPGMELQVRPRSSLFKTFGLLIPNSPGTVDTDYSGQLMVPVWRPIRPDQPDRIGLAPGDRIAQLILNQTVIVPTAWAERQSFAVEREGFGSTGIR